MAEPQQTAMAEPQKDLDKLRAEQEKDDADILDELEKESKAFDKVGTPGVACRRMFSHALG
jgi:DnaJ family protein C protein 8